MQATAPLQWLQTPVVSNPWDGKPILTSEQTDSEQTDSEQTDSEQTDSEQTDSEQTDSEKPANPKKPMNAISANTLATIAYAKQILADIDDSNMCQQPMGLNHPAWLLLHLATAADYAASLLGGNGVCPTEWNALADTKKPLTQNRSDYPSKDELVSKFEAAFRNAADLYQAKSENELNEPQKLGFFENELPTVGDMATFLMVAHTNLHLGQLSAWRRANGKSPLF